MKFPAAKLFRPRNPEPQFVPVVSAEGRSVWDKLLGSNTGTEPVGTGFRPCLGGDDGGQLLVAA